MPPRRCLKYVDPTRPPGAFGRGYAWFSSTRLGRFLSAKVVWKLDPYLLRATRGRVGVGLVLPTALLETRGAKTVTFGGIPMRAAVIDDEAERDRLWALADRVFAPYATYRRDAAKANRTIPIVQLEPRVVEAGG